MDNKIKSALIGGAVLGVLSAIPFVGALNLCCCAWAILGGALAVYMYVKGSPAPVSTGEGAMLGAMAGGIGAVIYVILGVPMNYIVGNTMARLLTSLMGNMDPAQAEAIRQQMEASQTIGAIIINAIIVAVLLAVFSTIGGLIGVPLFEKRKGGAGMPPPPPPPPGGYAGGGGAGAGYSGGGGGYNPGA